MIRHVVMFSAKDANDIPIIEEGLRLLADIPEHTHFEVARNLQCDQIANDMAVVVYAEFASKDALERYKQHPLYEEAIRIVRPLRDVRVAADFHSGAVRLCHIDELAAINSVINRAAEAYRGIITADCMRDPYMSLSALAKDIEDGVVFYGYEKSGALQGVMGLQKVKDAHVLRHAYVLPGAQGSGIGSALMRVIKQKSARPLYVGAWESAHWALKFYERHGFTFADEAERIRLLTTYWNVSPRQVETSVAMILSA